MPLAAIIISLMYALKQKEKVVVLRSNQNKFEDHERTTIKRDSWLSVLEQGENSGNEEDLESNNLANSN